VLVDACTQIHCSVLENFIVHADWCCKYASWVLLLVFMLPQHNTNNQMLQNQSWSCHLKLHDTAVLNNYSSHKQS
jgi:hypothetical protein